MKVTYGKAISDALREEMRRDDKIVIFGEDVAQFGNIFGLTRGFLEEFGPKRIRNTPITETAIIGAAIGAAETGLRPVAELMYSDFALAAFTEIFHCVAKWRYMHGPEYKVPLVIRNASGSKDNMKKGQIYGGLPYIGVASGNIYRLLGYMDPVTGAVDMSEATKNPKLFGNQCSIGAYWGWARVINSADYAWTQNMVQSNGFLRIGPYTYDDAVFTSFNDKDRTTIDVCLKNGKQKMFESYALLQPGDGLVYYTTAGHVIMCSVKAEVVRDANGEIDGDKSHIYIIDQGQSWVSMTNASGDSFKAKGSVDAKKSFNSLYNGYYLPFTFAEFLGTDPVEETECTFSHTEKDITVKQLTQAEVNANYGIADVYVIVKDSAGNLVYEKPIHSTMAGIVKVAMKGTVIEATWNRYAGNGNTVEVVCQLGTGERLTVYKGNLLK